MNVSYALSTPTIPVGETTRLSVVIRFGAGASSSPKRRLNLSLVLDRSGSMAGAPLKQAIKAAQALVGELHPEDRVSVVTYDDHVDTIVHPGLARDKAQIQGAIGRVHAGGCTNLSGGWLKGCDHVKAHLSPETVNRVLLLTDGQANAGVTDAKVLVKTAEERARGGVITTTLGFGANFNEDLLIGMARAAEGNFYFIESPEDVTQVFKIELEGLSSVVGQNLAVTVSPTESMQAQYVLNNYRVEHRGEELDVTIGDVYAVEDRTLALGMAAHPTREGTITLLRVEYTYQTVDGGAIRDVKGSIDVTVEAAAAARAHAAAPDLGVVGEASRLQAARTRDEAVSLADKGDLQKAAAELRRMAEELRRGPLAEKFEFVEEIDQLEHFADRLDRRSYDGALRKELRDQSYQATTRNRADLAQRGTTGGSSAGLPTVTSEDGGVALRCVRHGGKLRVHVTSAGWDGAMNVQFPRAIREEGVSYLVDRVAPSADGTFYRVEGPIRRLLRPGETAAPARAGGRRASPAKATKAAKTPQTAADLDTTTEVGTGVIVQCVKEGVKLRARVVSDGFNPDWNIRFPRGIRELGVLYVVDEVVEAGGGGSYIANGDIKRLIQ